MWAPSIFCWSLSKGPTAHVFLARSELIACWGSTLPCPSQQSSPWESTNFFFPFGIAGNGKIR